MPEPIGGHVSEGNSYSFFEALPRLSRVIVDDTFLDCDLTRAKGTSTSRLFIVQVSSAYLT